MEEEALHILIVDDAEEEREIYRRLLSRSGAAHVISEAATAAHALQILRASTPDCVLLDQSLPDMDGLEFLAHLDVARYPTAVLLLSGVDDQDLMRPAFENGVQDYLPKGTIEPQLLERAIRHAVARQRYREQILKMKREAEGELALHLTDPLRARTCEKCNGGST